MRFLHISDVHLEAGFSEVALSQFFNKRFVGWANLFLRRRKYYADAFVKMQALGSLVEEANVDVVLCTGDYTALGTVPELELARQVVDPLTKAPHGFATVPGNHDVYLDDGIGVFERIFDDLLVSDAPDLAVHGRWPLVRFFGDHVAVIGIDSTRPNPPIRRSSGRVPEPQLEGLRTVLADPRLAGKFVFVMTHYAPRLSSGKPDTKEHGLENADDLLEVCSAIEWGALLHGHVHKCYRVQVPEMKIPLCGAGSTTMRGREGLWIYDIEEGASFVTRGRFEDGRYTLDESTREPLMERLP